MFVNGHKVTATNGTLVENIDFIKRKHAQPYDNNEFRNLTSPIGTGVSDVYVIIGSSRISTTTSHTNKIHPMHDNTKASNQKFLEMDFIQRFYGFDTCKILLFSRFCPAISQICHPMYRSLFQKFLQKFSHFTTFTFDL